MVTLDKMNIMENRIYVRTAIIVNYFAMETQFNHLLAFHNVCSLAWFKMKHFLYIWGGCLRIAKDLTRSHTTSRGFKV